MVNSNPSQLSISHQTVFPWQELAPGSTVCDLGGGNGNTSIEIAKKFPHLKVHLQDLPDTIEEAKVVRIVIVLSRLDL